MNRKTIYFLALFVSAIYVLSINNTKSSESFDKNENKDTHSVLGLFNEIDLHNKISYQAFEQAMIGYNNISTKKKNIFTLIDFTKPSNEERLFIIDIEAKKIILSSLVSHGKKSGDKYATSFSNNVDSHQSSLGFYLTNETYTGKNGYSLFLDGLEKGINDKARQRAVVIHGAKYANPSVVKSGGRLGRSHGCPALPEAINKTVIDLIKGGSLVYIYANSKSYESKSSILFSKLSN